MTKQKASIREWEQLSAFLDGELDAKQSKRIEEQIATRQEISAAFDELSHTREVLKRSEKIKIPRNFTLTPSLVGIDEKRLLRIEKRIILFNSLRLSAVVATIMFFMVFLANFMVVGKRMTVGLEQKAAPQEAAKSVSTQPVAMAPAQIQTESVVTATPETQREPEQTEPEAVFKEETAPMIMEAPSAPGEGVGGGLGAVPESTAIAAIPSTPEAETVSADMANLMQNFITETAQTAEKKAALLASPTPIVTLEAEQSREIQPDFVQVGGQEREFNIWHWLEAIFAIIAIASGIAAFILRRRNR